MKNKIFTCEKCGQKYKMAITLLEDDKVLLAWQKIERERNKLKFIIIIEKDGIQFYGHIPELKGLHTCGDTIEETLRNVGNALSAYMESMIKHKDVINVGNKQ